MAARGQIPYPSDLSGWSRKKDGMFKKRMAMDEREFKMLQTTVRMITAARFDPLCTARKQPLGVLDVIKAEVCKVHGALLRNYERAWPVDILILAYVENRRYYANRKTRHAGQRHNKSKATSCAQQSEAQTRDESLELGADADLHEPSVSSDLNQSESTSVVESCQVVAIGRAVTHPSSLESLDHDFISLMASVEQDNLAATTGYNLLHESLRYNSNSAPISVSTLYSGTPLLRPSDPSQRLPSQTLVALLMTNSANDPETIQAFVYDGVELSSSEYAILALEEAVSREHWDVVIYLLQNGIAPSVEHLVAAASAGSLDAIRTMINMGADVNAPDECTITALQGALWGEHWDVAAFLLQHHATFSAYEFVTAARYGAFDVICAMVAAEADVNNLRFEEDTALRAAVRSGHADIVRFLLHHGADCSGDDLILAASSGFYDTAREIVEIGVSVHTTDILDRTPLIKAALNGHWDVVSFLLTCGAEYSVNDVIDASRKGALDVVRHIIDTDMVLGLFSENDWGYTPLTAALEQGRRNVVDLLLERGAPCSSQDTLVFASGAGFLDVVWRALRNGAMINAQAMDDRTAIQASLFAKHTTVTDFLLQIGAGYGSNELVVACEAGALCSVEELIRRGVSVNAPGLPRPHDLHKISPLTAARMHPDIIIFLLQNGAECTPDDLVSACKRGQLRVVQELVAKGVDVNKFGFLASEGLSCLPLDAARDQPRITQYLMEHGALPVIDWSRE